MPLNQTREPYYTRITPGARPLTKAGGGSITGPAKFSRPSVRIDTATHHSKSLDRQTEIRWLWPPHAKPAATCGRWLPLRGFLPRLGPGRHREVGCWGLFDLEEIAASRKSLPSCAKRAALDLIALVIAHCSRKASRAIELMVGVAGFEPATPTSRRVCGTTNSRYCVRFFSRSHSNSGGILRVSCLQTVRQLRVHFWHFSGRKQPPRTVGSLRGRPIAPRTVADPMNAAKT
jgi:hypothetical protein